MFGLELWFIFAVLSPIIGGFGAFANKVAAEKKYNSQMVVIINAALSVLLFGPPALLLEGQGVLSWPLFLFAFAGGVFFSFSSVIKIQVLHYIDSAIFLPLFKVTGPLIVIFFGIILFGESFSIMEWIGLTVSLCVPLLLISRVENSRQNNLALGLILILVTSVTSAVAAALNKYATDINGVPFWIMTTLSVGIFISTVLHYSYIHRRSLVGSVVNQYSHGVLKLAFLRTVLAGGGMVLAIAALSYGGPLGIVYTINSLYILPPIILAIIFYGEHWNFRKALAIVLSVLALVLLQ